MSRRCTSSRRRPRSAATGAISRRRSMLATTGRWGGLVSSPAAFASDRSNRTAKAVPVGDGSQTVDAGVPFFKRYFLGGASSLRGWGRYEVSPLNSEGFADRRAQHARAVVRAALPDPRQAHRRPVRRRRQVSARVVAVRAARPALRRRHRRALSHAYRPDALRLRLSAQPDSGPAHRRRAADSAAGGCTSASGQAF